MSEAAWSDLRKRYGGGGAPAAEGQEDWEALHKRYSSVTRQADPEAPPPVDFAGNLEFATPWGRIDTGISLPQAANKRLAQLGSGFADWDLGARQIVASDKKTVRSLVTGKDDSEKARLEDEALDKRRLDGRLTDDFAGKALQFGGQVAPTLVIPGGALGNVARGATPLLEGALVGGASAAFQPTAPGESRAANIGMGATAGAVMPGVIAGARTMLRPRAADLPLVRTAMDRYGIPLGPADVTRSKAVKAARAVLDDLPVTGAVGGAQSAAKQRAYNRAVGGTFGAAEDSLTPDVVGAARDRIGSQFDQVWNTNTLNVDQQMFRELTALRAEADKLAQGESNRLHGWLDDVYARMTPGPNGQPTIPGDVANRLQSTLRKQAGSATGFLKDNMTALRQSLLTGFNRSVSGADADTLRTALGQYKALKTVEPLLGSARSAANGRVTGDVPAALMPGAVNRSYSGLATRAQQPELVDLATIGSRYLVPRVEKTGGSLRAAVQNVGLGGSGASAGLAYWLGGPKALTGLGGAALGQYMLGAPWLTRWAMNGPVRRGLLDPVRAREAVRELGLLTLERTPGLLAPSLLATPPEDEGPR